MPTSHSANDAYSYLKGVVYPVIISQFTSNTFYWFESEQSVKIQIHFRAYNYRPQDYLLSQEYFSS